MIFLEEQLSFLRAIQTMRGEGVDALFFFLNFFDSDLFALFFVWLVTVRSKKWGIRLAFLISIDALVNYALKQSFGSPRPYAFDSSLAMVPTSTSFGLPSGGAEMAFLIGAWIAYYGQKNWHWIIGFLYALSVGFSRMFLGVHFPIDVVVAWAVGLAVFSCFVWSVERIENFVSERPSLSWSLFLTCDAIFYYFLPSSTTLHFGVAAALLASVLFIRSFERQRVII